MYDAAGTHQWTQQDGTSGYDPGSGLAIGPAGNLYVVGWTDGVLDPNSPVGGQTDAFVAKYTPSGTQDWVRQRGSWTTDSGRAVAVNENGQVFVAGDSSDAFDNHMNQGFDDVFVMSYDAGGHHLWTDFQGTAASDSASGIATSDGDPFTVGSTQGSLNGNTNAGGSDLFLMRHDQATGVLQWTQQRPGTADDDTAYAVDATGNREYVVGATAGGAGNAGQRDAFALVYDNSGVLQ